MTEPVAVPLVLAHRGAAAVAPENTLPALARAMAFGADGVEFDVQRTADGVLVLVHDDDWLRTTGVAAPVRQTPWARVQGFDAGAWFGPAFRGTAPPTLATALALLPDGACVDVEIKSPERDPGLGRAVRDAVRSEVGRLRLLLTSFDHACIDGIADGSDGIEYGLLGTSLLPPRRDRHQALAAAVLLAAPEHVAAVHRTGAQVFAWTVDDPAVVRRLVQLGVDAIITNDPEKVRAALRSQR